MNAAGGTSLGGTHEGGHASMRGNAELLVSVLSPCFPAAHAGCGAGQGGAEKRAATGAGGRRSTATAGKPGLLQHI